MTLSSMHVIMAATGTIALATLAPVSPAPAQALPEWQPRSICSKDSARGQCALFERRARGDVSASWDILPKTVRQTCLTKLLPPLDPSWRLLADCIEIEGRRAHVLLRQKREAREQALVERKAAEDAELRKRQIEADAAADQKRVEEEEASFMKLLADQRRAEKEAAAARKAAREDAERRRVAAEEASFMTLLAEQRRAEAEAKQKAAEKK